MGRGGFSRTSPHSCMLACVLQAGLSASALERALRHVCVCRNRARVCVGVCSRENICSRWLVGQGKGWGAAGVCRVRGLQLLIAGWYTDTDRGIWGTDSLHSAPVGEWVMGLAGCLLSERRTRCLQMPAHRWPCCWWRQDGWGRGGRVGVR